MKKSNKIVHNQKVEITFYLKKIIRKKTQKYHLDQVTHNNTDQTLLVDRQDPGIHISFLLMIFSCEKYRDICPEINQCFSLKV